MPGSILTNVPLGVYSSKRGRFGERLDQQTQAPLSLADVSSLRRFSSDSLPVFRPTGTKCIRGSCKINILLPPSLLSFSPFTLSIAASQSFRQNNFSFSTTLSLNFIKNRSFQNYLLFLRENNETKRFNKNR